MKEENQTEEESQPNEVCYSDKFLKFMELLTSGYFGNWDACLNAACEEIEADPEKMAHEIELAFKRATKPVGKINKKPVPMISIDELRSGGYLQEVIRERL